MTASTAPAGTPGYGKGREALLRAAVDVVAQKGLRGLTYRAVAEAAGVNNSLVAHHFGSRDALIAAALRWASEQSIAASRLREAAEQEGSFTEALLELLLEDPGLQVFQYEMILEARRRPELAGPVAELYENYVNALAEGLQAFGVQGDVRIVARTLFAALDGLVLQYLAGVGRDQIAAALEEVHRVVLSRREA
ncbi:TetR family transcriptional regulator [Arthrobacter sp. FX8]|jgi:AcrR family transcriptional regulator|uniref:TetR/AcrR family transcriptional regulator n=1 Tax=Arthrobacter sp. FX8 TaxID=2997335 RepID=UPI00227C68AA|nr:TetR/AcrR family transcriptional regulator [Arthrobacter sp. FX8]WAJ32520.1 TetR family transcriptional regulator [Arthrobacter sp. FX8]